MGKSHENIISFSAGSPGIAGGAMHIGAHQR